MTIAQEHLDSFPLRSYQSFSYFYPNTLPACQILKRVRMNYFQIIESIVGEQKPGH